MLGEGSFLDLLAFLERPRARPGHPPGRPPGARDEARHVAFGVAHLEHQARLDPALRGRLRAAVERRHDALVDTAGLNADVFDALVVLAAGEWTPAAIARGYRAVEELDHAMDDGRRHGSSASASRPTRRPSCRRCTPATSCEEFELVPYWYPTTAHLHCIQPTGGRMIWFAIALVLFACGGVALWLSRAPRRPEPRPIPHDEPENLFEPRSSREDPSP